MRTSIYLSKQRAAAIEAIGVPLVDIIDAGIAVLTPAGEKATRQKETPGSSCKHPRARVHKGLCGACGQNVSR